VCEQRNDGGLRIPFFHDDEKAVVDAEFQLSDTYSGAPTLVHGGAQLAVLDEAMAWATIAIGGQWAFTAKSSAVFGSPVHVDVAHRVVAKVTSQEGDRIATVGRIETLDSDVCTESVGELVVLRAARALRIVGEPTDAHHEGFLRSPAGE